MKSLIIGVLFLASLVSAAEETCSLNELIGKDLAVKHPAINISEIRSNYDQGAPFYYFARHYDASKNIFFAGLVGFDSAQCKINSIDDAVIERKVDVSQCDPYKDTYGFLYDGQCDVQTTDCVFFHSMRNHYYSGLNYLIQDMYLNDHALVVRGTTEKGKEFYMAGGYGAHYHAERQQCLISGGWDYVKK